MQLIYKNITTAFLGILFAAALIIVSPDAKAAQNQAESLIADLGSTALMSLTEEGIKRPERETRIRKILHDSFDIATIGRFAMGTYWREATKEQKQEYLKLFEEMVVQTYTTRFEEYSGQKLKVLGSTESGKRDHLVSSQVLQEGAPPINLEWRVRNKNNKFSIIDVVVEGVSMSVTQRSDFAAVIQRNGGDIEALLTVLRERNSSPEKT